MDPFRGLSAKARHIISEAGSIVCGNKTFPLAKLNDDYCDCMNGADEPGTSACKDARFTCADEHLQINSMFVDDGVCDCCDGSDEMFVICSHQKPPKNCHEF
eukprot:TRINITY_DN7117_c0_g1_i5.p2 TRINITY_DN7117_c0_g1~~TRINITY_DN7117_c0_g1_i5.p2  ORF type:complete len:102 (+),score=14.81 TRINITY_DN7117_c0_g1_i5:445-750(+)